MNGRRILLGAAAGILAAAGTAGARDGLPPLPWEPRSDWIDVRSRGAAGDGRADDTEALRKTVAAARAHGRDALAYLPAGTYLVRETLRLEGRDYRLGGAGWGSRLVWKGPPGGTILAVHDPENLVLEHLSIGSHDAGKMDNAIDIHQTGTDRPSRMTYDGVFVYGMYQKDPLRKGLRLEGLGEKAVVSLPHVQGNLRIVDCARATILAGCSYEGTVVVEGKDRRRGGLTGFLTRLGTSCPRALIVRDNQSVVMSDFYIEQAENGYLFEGSPGDPPGRVTLQGAKVDFFDAARGEARAAGTALEFRGYSGRVFFGPNQFYCNPERVRIRQEGDAPLELFLLGCCFYKTRLDVEKGPGLRLYLAGNEAVASPAAAVEDVLPPEGLAAAAEALDDLRRLGREDLRIHHGIESPR